LQRHRATWPAEWLRRHGRDDAAEQWVNYYIPSNGVPHEVETRSTEKATAS